MASDLESTVYLYFDTLTLWTSHKAISLIIRSVENVEVMSSFRVMTYNVRMNTLLDGHHRWQRRRDRVINLIEKYAPDLLGVQEPDPEQMSDLRAGLSAYGSSGVGRDDGANRGEFSAIFYRHDRYELIDQGTFWLSETPSTPGSKGWDAACPRICSWVRLNDRRTNKHICHFNAHLDHRGVTARLEGVKLILNRVQQIVGSSTPTIVTGDFNVPPKSDAYRAMVTNTVFQDAKLASDNGHSGPEGSWSTFNVKHGIGDRIDYIFITPTYLKVSNHVHLTDAEDMSYPSDHLPVLAELTLTDR